MTVDLPPAETTTVASETTGLIQATLVCILFLFSLVLTRVAMLWQPNQVIAGHDVLPNFTQVCVQ